MTRTAPGALGGGEQRRGHRRPVGGPAVVGRVDGVVEGGGAAGGGGERLGVGRVDLPVLDRVGGVGRRCARAPGPGGPRAASSSAVVRADRALADDRRAVPWCPPRLSSRAVLSAAIDARRLARALSRAVLSTCVQCSRPAHRRMVSTARERVRAELTAEITDAARRQLAEVGAAALSLRAVARELGMASSALYRYFPSRDDLLTRLIIDGYDALGAAAEAADDPAAAAAGAVAGRLPGGPRLGAGPPARVRAALRLPGARLPGAARTPCPPPPGWASCSGGILGDAARAGGCPTATGERDPGWSATRPSPCSAATTPPSTTGAGARAAGVELAVRDDQLRAVRPLRRLGRGRRPLLRPGDDRTRRPVGSAG